MDGTGYDGPLSNVLEWLKSFVITKQRQFQQVRGVLQFIELCASVESKVLIQ